MKPLYAPPALVKTPSVRPELVQFVRATEGVLSPAVRNADLTPEECDLIATYVENLSQARYPWGKSLRLKYA